MERVEVRENGLVASFFTSGSRVRPGVVALGGSEGSCPVYLGELLAQAGFACLALQYFGAPGLPRNLVEVPLDSVEAGMEWLQQRPEVTEGPIGLVGASKGAELALLCATTFPVHVGAVVAYAPSSVAFGGISFRGAGRRRSSWSLRGSPVAFVPYAHRSLPALRPRGLALAPMYRAALENSEAVADAAIPIERATAPILLLSGDRDSMWPSSEMATQVAKRAAEAGSGDRVTHIRYTDAGHSFIPWAPDMRSRRLQRFVNGARLAGVGAGLELGGRPRANREALRDAWEHAKRHLATHLG